MRGGVFKWIKIRKEDVPRRRENPRQAAFYSVPEAGKRNVHQETGNSNQGNRSANGPDRECAGKGLPVNSGERKKKGERL